MTTTDRPDNQPTRNLHPIETEYRGYRFRSRLEARWAVFFDAMRHDWAYEEQGFELPSGRYLPDFRIKGFDVFVEIKPDEPSEREKQLGLEMVEGGANFVLFFGSDPAAVFSRWTWPTVARSTEPQSWMWDSADMPGLWAPALSARTAYFIATFCWRQPITFAACKKARRARFEHGEQG